MLPQSLSVFKTTATIKIGKADRFSEPKAAAALPGPAQYPGATPESFGKQVQYAFTSLCCDAVVALAATFCGRCCASVSVCVVVALPLSICLLSRNCCDCHALPTQLYANRAVYLCIRVCAQVNSAKKTGPSLSFRLGRAEVDKSLAKLASATPGPSLIPPASLGPQVCPEA